MIANETLNFKIGLSRSSNKKCPAFNVMVNNTRYISTSITVPADEVEYFEFATDITEGKCELVIEFINKTDQDTIKNQAGEIVDDLLLSIKSITIDEIDLGSLLYTVSSYEPEYPDAYKNDCIGNGKELPEIVKNCVDLGWNGRWILTFQSPFYIWLLENI